MEIGAKTKTKSSGSNHVADFAGSGHAHTEDDLHIVSERVVHSQQKQRYTDEITQPRQELQKQHQYLFEETFKPSSEIIKPERGMTQESTRQEQHYEASGRQGMTIEAQSGSTQGHHFEQTISTREMIQPLEGQTQELVAPVEMIKKEVTIIRETSNVAEVNNQKAEEKQIKDEIQVENERKLLEESQTSE